jgi:hypothetical protein
MDLLGKWTDGRSSWCGESRRPGRDHGTITIRDPDRPRNEWDRTATITRDELKAKLDRGDPVTLV